MSRYRPLLLAKEQWLPPRALVQPEVPAAVRCPTPHLVPGAFGRHVADLGGATHVEDVERPWCLGCGQRLTMDRNWPGYWTPDWFCIVEEPW